MALDNEILAVGAGIISSIISSAISYGHMKQKVEDLEKAQTNYVNKETFQMVVDSLKENIGDIKTYVKELLRRSEVRRCEKCSNYEE